MVRKLGGEDDRFVSLRYPFACHSQVLMVWRSFLSYRTSQYKLHYYETPTNTKFVMLTDIKSGSMRIALQQIYVNCYVEYVVKNPLSPVEHPGGIGVNNELFEASLEQFVVRMSNINPRTPSWANMSDYLGSSLEHSLSWANSRSIIMPLPINIQQTFLYQTLQTCNFSERRGSARAVTAT